MSLPRDLSAREFINALARIGYAVVRQSGSHVRLTSNAGGAQHHVTVPNHDPIKIGTLGAILNNIAAHRNITRQQLLDELNL